jgi:hypothetical protein
MVTQTPLHLPMSIFADLLHLHWDPRLSIMKTDGVVICLKLRAHVAMRIGGG